MSLLRCYSLKKRNNVTVNLTVGVVVFLGLLGNCVLGSLNLTKPCEDTVCQALEYCSKIDHTCKPCKDICESGDGNHNYDENRCYSDCQDYIHEVRYLNASQLEQFTELEEKYKELEKDVLILKIVVGVCIAVIVLVVACLIAFFVYFWKLMHPTQPGTPEKKKPNAVNKTASVELPTVYNNRYGVTTPTPETSPSSVMSSSPADTNITTLTSTSTIPPYHAHPTTPTGGVGIRSSPAKSQSSVTTPGTATTTLNSSASTIVNGGPRNGSIANRFRREPSESTLPDNCAYDNLSMSPQHIHYSHHV